MLEFISRAVDSHFSLRVAAYQFSYLPVLEALKAAKIGALTCALSTMPAIPTWLPLTTPRSPSSRSKTSARSALPNPGDRTQQIHRSAEKRRADIRLDRFHELHRRRYLRPLECRPCLEPCRHRLSISGLLGTAATGLCIRRSTSEGWPADSYSQLW